METSKLFSLEGRVALITGGSRAIGLWIAEGFVAQGAKVYINARKRPELEAAAQALGPNCVPIVQDISTLEGCRALADAFMAREASLDILVNNAGAAWGAPFAEFPEAGWDKVLDLNLKSPFFLTQALYEPLKAAAGKGPAAKVINISSVDAFRVNDWETYSYQASKAGLIQLTRRMAARLVADNINVTAIAPGAFPSAMNRAARDHADLIGAKIPAGRVGDGADIAAAAIYLASRAGDYVIGETLTVDGGLTHAQAAPSIDF